jgi:threonine 3-dehydrogenase
MQVGHEYVGEVVEIGQEVRGFQIGDRVSGEGHITCGFCRNCRAGRRHLCRNTTGVGVNRAGAFAEYLVIPAFNAFKIPAGISDELASISLRQRHSYRIVVQPGRDSADHRPGPIGTRPVAIARMGARNVSSPTSTSIAWTWRASGATRNHR